MLNIFSGMNIEKLMVAFLTGMPKEKKEEWLTKMEDAHQQAAQTANDFAHIKETTDILLTRLNEVNERLSTAEGILLGRIEDTAQSIEVAATEAAIAADNTDEILEEIKEGD